MGATKQRQLSGGARRVQQQHGARVCYAFCRNQQGSALHRTGPQLGSAHGTTQHTAACARGGGGKVRARASCECAAYISPPCRFFVILTTSVTSAAGSSSAAASSSAAPPAPGRPWPLTRRVIRAAAPASADRGIVRGDSTNLGEGGVRAGGSGKIAVSGAATVTAQFLGVGGGRVQAGCLLRTLLAACAKNQARRDPAG